MKIRRWLQPLFSFILVNIIAIEGKTQQPKLMLPVGHSHFLSQVEISGDGRRTLTSSEYSGAILWDNRSGLIIKKWPNRTEDTRLKLASINHNGEYALIRTGLGWHLNRLDAEDYFQMELKGITHAVFSNDGRRLATLYPGRVVLWDLAAKSKVIEFGVETGHTTLLYSGDDSMIITYSTGEPSGISVWDAATGNRKLQIRPSAAISKILANRRMTRIAVQSDDGSILIYNGADAAVVAIIPKARLEGFSFDENPSRLLVRTNDRISCWDPENGTLVNFLDPGYLSAYDKVFFFGKDPERICILGSSRISTWDIGTGEQLAETANPANAYGHAISVNREKSLVAFASYESTETVLLNLKSMLKPILLKSSSAAFRSILPVGNGNQFLISTLLGTSVWDCETARQVVALEQAAGLYAVSISRDNRYMAGITGEKDQYVRRWSLATGKGLGLLQGDADSGKHRSVIDGIVFNNRGNELAAGDEEGFVHFWNFPGGKKILKKKMHENSINDLDFNPSDSVLATGGHGSQLKIWDAVTLRLIREIRLPPFTTVDKLEFSPDGSLLVASFFPRDFLLVVYPKKNYATEQIQFPGAITDFQFSSHNKSLLVSTYQGLYSLDAGLFRKTVFENNVKRISSAVFSADGQRLLLTYDDHSAEWRTAAGALLYSFYHFNSAEYFAQIPSGYYHCSPGAARLLHYVTGDFRLITFEQLDVRYNRPDKVLEAIGSKDTAMIRSYRRAWERRIKKLGIDTTAFRDGYSVPECDFVNRDKIDYEQKTGTLTLRIRGIDSTCQLDRFNVWVNEAPVFGQRGISIRRKNSNSLDTTIAIKLSQGENRIETSITNVNGTESYRMPLVVNYTPAVKQKETLRFIGIGIDKFAAPKNNLQYSSKDIRDLSVKLKEKYKDDIIIDTLFNEDVTIRNVKALKQKLQETSVNDKVIISYSGHGLLSKEYDYYLSTYNINFDKPEENGLAYEELESLLDSIPARKKLMLIDACHSGEVDKEEIALYRAVADSLRKKGTKGGELRYTGKTQVGMKNSFELMQSLFVNVGKSTGATIISAAAGTQFALERGDLKNGVFTYSILEAMDKNPTMKISDLKKTVGERVEQLTNGLQKPTSRNETIATDWNLW